MTDILRSDIGEGVNFQVQLSQLSRQKFSNTRLIREQSATSAAMIGGSGDPDMRRFLTDELSNHVQIQVGPSSGADVYGNIALNLTKDFYSDQRKFADGSPITIENSASSMWGQQYIQDPDNS